MKNTPVHLPLTIRQWLLEQDWEPYSLKVLSGGCINQNYLLESRTGVRCFVKTHPSPPTQFFQKEANNLTALAATQTVRTPNVLFVDHHGLILEYIAPGRENHHYWQNAAAQLAALHELPQTRFGFLENNYCGITPQSNKQHANGHEFFFHERLLPQAKLARHNKYLTTTDYHQVERLGIVLPNIIPVQPPCLVHGDLWSGNFYCDTQGEPVFIDPACYWGWAETDLALSALFGGVSRVFYQHYTMLRPESRNWEERQDIYNLYHILNHLNLFGSSYYQQAKQTLNYYVHQ